MVRRILRAKIRTRFADAAGLRLELRLGPHPAQDLLRIGQEGEHRGGRRRDVRLAADDEGLLHRSPP